MILLLLLCHLVGDYVLQSHKMAIRKTSSMTWALIHAAFYSIPFAVLLVLTARSVHDGVCAWVVIAGTHALIDRYKVADRWCRWYGVGHPGLWWRTHCYAGHPMGGEQMCPEDYCIAPPAEPFPTPPPFLGVWLTIVVDNTFHLAINALAVWLATGGVL